MSVVDHETKINGNTIETLCSPLRRTLTMHRLMQFGHGANGTLINIRIDQDRWNTNSKLMHIRNAS